MDGARGNKPFFQSAGDAVLRAIIVIIIGIGSKRADCEAARKAEGTINAIEFARLVTHKCEAPFTGFLHSIALYLVKVNSFFLSWRLK